MSKFNVHAYDANSKEKIERIELIDTATNNVFGYDSDLDCDDVKEFYEDFWKDNRFGELITVSKVERIEVVETVEF